MKNLIRTIILGLVIVSITSCVRSTCKYHKKSIEENKDIIFKLQVDYDLGLIEYDNYKEQLEWFSSQLELSEKNYEYNKCKN